ncbi:MAG: hypothetical protein JSR47_07700 [Proteobacteria bacterium]|nr:hypothetical protein [Pseudomonadota bacterium]MBS0548614.1 hypothetical protein [Pseudomonadota bacterium]
MIDRLLTNVRPAMVLALSLAALVAGCVQDAAPLPTYDRRVELAKSGIGTVVKVVSSGVASTVYFKMSLNPDCTSRGDYTLQITTAPKHGAVSMVRSSEYPDFRPDNTRSACNKNKAPSNSILYTSQPGYTGEDRFQVDFISPDGNLYRTAFFITVR